MPSRMSIIVPALFEKGPCKYMVDAWALQGLLYPYFGVYVGTRMILRPFGFSHSTDGLRLLFVFQPKLPPKKFQVSPAPQI